MIAVAAQPLLRDVAFHAAALEEADAEPSLVAEFLVRVSRSTAGHVLDTYHHKVREAVVGLMAPDERRACHERGRMGDAFRHAVQAEDILESRCSGVAWELAATRIWSLSALSYSGRWKEYTTRMDAVLREAERNGNRYAQCALPLSTGCYGIHLAADRPEAARRVLDEKIALWRRPALDYPRLGHWKGMVETLLYEQHYEEAWQTVSTMWALWRHSLVLHVHLARFLAEMLRARCALGLHSVSPDPSPLGVAERFVRWSTRSSAVLVQGWGLLIDAAMNVSAGQRERAVAKLQLAEQRLDEAGALQVVAVSLQRRGELIGGIEGSRLVHLADQQFLDLGVTNPARMTARFLPGHFSSSP